MRAGLPPGGRAECKDGPRPCQYIRCKWHLWLVEGADRPGRRHEGRSPATAIRNDVLEAVARGEQLPPSCALDVAERKATARDVGMTIEDTAAALGVEHSILHAIQARALAKLRAIGATLEELQLALAGFHR